MNLTLMQIANHVGGTVQGNPERVIHGAAAFETAAVDQISLAAFPKFLKNIEKTAAGALIVPLGSEARGRDSVSVDNPEAAFAKTVALFNPPSRPAQGVSPLAVIGAGAVVGEGVSLAPFVFVGRNVRLGNRTVVYPHVFIGNGAVVGDDTVIHPNVTIREECRIGDRVILHAGSVIGSDGYGFAQEGTRHRKIPQIGMVQIDDDVEIGACNTIDRAAFGRTWIQRGVKTDNQVHIAHNVTVGEDSLIVAQAAISGSTTLGKNVVMAGKASAVPHITIGDRVVIAPKASLAKSVESDQVLSGTPAMPHRHWLRVQRVYGRLPELNKKVLELEKRIHRLTEILEEKTVERGEKR